jgi:hypothetical protein
MPIPEPISIDCSGVPCRCLNAWSAATSARRCRAGGGPAARRQSGNRMSHRWLDWCLHVAHGSQEVDLTRYSRVPEAEINGISGKLATTTSRRMLGEVPVPIAAPASGTSVGYDPAGGATSVRRRAAWRQIP